MDSVKAVSCDKTVKNKAERDRWTQQFSLGGDHPKFGWGQWLKSKIGGQELYVVCGPLSLDWGHVTR